MVFMFYTVNIFPPFLHFCMAKILCTLYTSNKTCPRTLCRAKEQMGKLARAD